MMDGDFTSLRIDGGMFSPEFLQRVADASPELDGCSPADYSTAEEGVNNLRDHLNYLWNRSIAVWDRFGPSGEEEIPASRVRGFLQKLMRDLGLDLSGGISKHQSTGDRPQLDYDLGGALWHVVASEVHLDQRSESIGTRRTSPHNLLQGELTSSKHHGWGLLTNGRQVRILRKTNRPSIQEALEFDIETMFNDRLYPDFCLFAMMVHGTRWSRNKDAPMDCWLETWYKASKEEGLSVLEDLRGCVQQAANALGTGLVRFQAGNQHLRDRLRSEAGLADELQREIMRYMYKLIFLFVMEDRNLLLRGHGEDLTPELETARERYMLGYSTQRHRSVVATTKGDEHHNYFEEVKLVIGFLYNGEERLALPALGSYLFSDQSTEIIDRCTLLNTDFMKTLYHLCTFKKKDGPRQRVHWKTLRETELGSVYESLLELRPSIDLDNGTFSLVLEAGNDRKSSGSYYTPAELVDHLITTTIDPLLDEAKKKARKDADSPEEYPRLAQEAILKLTVCDPACGSGHFLVAALERIAMELARIETGEQHPGISFIRKWKRVASSRCIYGVDLNPLAVELCKVAIWMDTYDGTNPLSFLDGHIRHGNSLLGQRLEKMGLIPDDAIPKAWAEQRTAHRNFNRAQLRKATKKAEERLKTLQLEYGKRKKRTAQPGLGAFTEMPLDGKSDEELKQEIDQLKVAIEAIEAQKLLPPDIVWSTVDLPSVIADIAAQQADVTLMSEANLEQIELKATQLQRLNTDDHSNWAKEVLDASMAMWWWPDPEIDEHKQMMADPPVPLASIELNRYATWLAYQYGIEDDVLSNRAAAIHNFSDDETRFALIRAHSEQLADKQSFFHWELEFAEVFFVRSKGEKMGGFSAVLGNPPFLGGQKLTGTYGNEFRDFIVQTIANGTKGSADLCSYFFLVCYDSIKQNGRAGLVATNTIAQGATREIGLAKIMKQGGTIPAARVDVPWAGDAAVMVNAVTIKRGNHTQLASLNGILVESINEYLVKPGSIVGDPHRLAENANLSFQGSILLGDGFLMSPKDANELIELDGRNVDVLFPCLNGKELNTNPSHLPSRWCINFLDWDEDRCKQFVDVWRIIEDKVKPFRQKHGFDGWRKKSATYYWQYEGMRISQYEKTRTLSRVMVIALTSKVVMPVWVPSNWVYSHACGVFNFDDDFTFGVLSSQLHWWWTQQYASSMKGDTRYTPSDVFETFPRPSYSEMVERIGFELNAHRAALMIEKDEGLTKTYNRFHNPEDNDPDIEKLRELHQQLDVAVRDAYGWDDIDLGHGFHNTKQGIRRTISQDAQREILDRLLALNHERFENEQ